MRERVTDGEEEERKKEIKIERKKKREGVLNMICTKQLLHPVKIIAVTPVLTHPLITSLYIC